MRIGQFCKENQITVDTVRYYVELGLLVPVKSNSYFDFDETCQNDLDFILLLKEMGFKLKEINDMLLKKRFGYYAPAAEVEYMVNKYQQRVSEINRTEQSLQYMKQLIASELEKLLKKEKQQTTFGVGVDLLSALACNSCQSSFKIKDASIQHGRIINGVLTCECGESIIIDNGIMIGQHDFSNRHVNDVEDISLIYNDYSNSANPAFLTSLYYSINFIKKSIANVKPKPKLILEFGVGSGFFLKDFINYLNNDDTYIAIDHDLKRLELLRDILIENNIRKNILLICSDFMQIPLKRKSADIIIDFFSSMSYALDNVKPLMLCFKEWMHKDSKYYGCFAVFNNIFSRAKEIIKCEKVFSIAGVRKILEQSKLSITLECLSNKLNEFKDDNRCNTGKDMRIFTAECKIEE